KGNRPASDYILSGLIKCANCGTNFHGSRYHRKYIISRIYRCGGYNMYGNSVCTRWEVSAEEIENFVIEYIHSKIDNPGWRAELREELLRVVKITESSTGNRLHELDKEVKELSLKIENWKKALEKGLELDNTVNIINKYVFQREQLYQEKSRLLAKASRGNCDKIAEKMLSYLDDFKDTINHGKAERKKEFIRLFVKGVVMDPKTKQAKITLYSRPLSGIMSEDKKCKLTEEIIYQN
ncbi:zinc ribbon domain-containing protein, partial [Candidatus Omnitrophota bacterium]